MCGSELRFGRRFFSNQFSFVVQFAFAHMGAVAYMHFAGGAVFAQRNFHSLVVGAALGAALL